MISVAVIFGGMSTEHDVSIVSGTYVVKNLNKEKYNVYPIYIDKEGTYYKYNKDISEMKEYKVGEEFEDKEKIDNIQEYLKNIDVIFPVLHGMYGEDGTIQGLFELLKKPYVGCKVLASSVGMDKVYTKIIFEKANINQTPYVYIRRYNNEYIYIDSNFNEKRMSLSDVAKIVEENIKYPMFIKPSNSGSSVGIKRAENIEELKTAIEYASEYDKKILVEQGIDGQEVECAVLGNEDVEATVVGEILPAEEFYTFDAKYNNVESKTKIPANISEEKQKEIKELAIKAFKSIDGKGLSRVDFFVERNTKKVYINEINTLPGFTNISMYTKLWEAMGVSYENLLDRLIELALN